MSNSRTPLSKFLSLLIVLAMVLSMAPMSVFADEIEGQPDDTIVEPVVEPEEPEVVDPAPVGEPEVVDPAPATEPVVDETVEDPAPATEPVVDETVEDPAPPVQEPEEPETENTTFVKDVATAIEEIEITGSAPEKHGKVWNAETEELIDGDVAASVAVTDVKWFTVENNNDTAFTGETFGYNTVYKVEISLKALYNHYFDKEAGVAVSIDGIDMDENPEDIDLIYSRDGNKDLTIVVLYAATEKAVATYAATVTASSGVASDLDFSAAGGSVKVAVSDGEDLDTATAFKARLYATKSKTQVAVADLVLNKDYTAATSALVVPENTGTAKQSYVVEIALDGEDYVEVEDSVITVEPYTPVLAKGTIKLAGVGGADLLAGNFDGTKKGQDQSFSIPYTATMATLAIPTKASAGATISATVGDTNVTNDSGAANIAKIPFIPNKKTVIEISAATNGKTAITYTINVTRDAPTATKADAAYYAEQIKERGPDLEISVPYGADATAAETAVMTAVKTLIPDSALFVATVDDISTEGDTTKDATIAVTASIAVTTKAGTAVTAYTGYAATYAGTGEIEFIVNVNAAANANAQKALKAIQTKFSTGAGTAVVNLAPVANKAAFNTAIAAAMKEKIKETEGYTVEVNISTDGMTFPFNASPAWTVEGTATVSGTGADKASGDVGFKISVGQIEGATMSVTSPANYNAKTGVKSGEVVTVTISGKNLPASAGILVSDSADYAATSPVTVSGAVQTATFSVATAGNYTVSYLPNVNDDDEAADGVELTVKVRPAPVVENIFVSQDDIKSVGETINIQIKGANLDDVETIEAFIVLATASATNASSAKVATSATPTQTIPLTKNTYRGYYEGSYTFPANNEEHAYIGIIGAKVNGKVSSAGRKVSQDKVTVIEEMAVYMPTLSSYVGSVAPKVDQMITEPEDGLTKTLKYTLVGDLTQAVGDVRIEEGKNYKADITLTPIDGYKFKIATDSITIDGATVAHTQTTGRAAVSVSKTYPVKTTVSVLSAYTSRDAQGNSNKLFLEFNKPLAAYTTLGSTQIAYSDGSNEIFTIATVATGSPATTGPKDWTPVANSGSRVWSVDINAVKTGTVIVGLKRDAFENSIYTIDESLYEAYANIVKAATPATITGITVSKKAMDNANGGDVTVTVNATGATTQSWANIRVGLFDGVTKYYDVPANGSGTSATINNFYIPANWSLDNAQVFNIRVSNDGGRTWPTAWGSIQSPTVSVPKAVINSVKVGTSPTTTTNEAEIAIGGGETFHATVAVTGDSYVLRSIDWKLTGSSINSGTKLTVGYDPLVAGVQIGDNETAATLALTASLGGKEWTVVIDVTGGVTGVTISDPVGSNGLVTYGEFVKGQTKQWYASADSTNKNLRGIEWFSSNPAVATVNANGLVTLEAAGITTITVKSKFNPNHYATRVVNVVAASAESAFEIIVTPSTTAITLAKGNMSALLYNQSGAKLAPFTISTGITNATTFGNFTWKSSDAKVAKVTAKNGAVTVEPVAGGVTTITATVNKNFTIGEKSYTKNTVVSVIFTLKDETPRFTNTALTLNSLSVDNVASLYGSYEPAYGTSVTGFAVVGEAGPKNHSDKFEVVNNFNIKVKTGNTNISGKFPVLVQAFNGSTKLGAPVTITVTATNKNPNTKAAWDKGSSLNSFFTASAGETINMSLVDGKNAIKAADIDTITFDGELSKNFEFTSRTQAGTGNIIVSAKFKNYGIAGGAEENGKPIVKGTMTIKYKAATGYSDQVIAITVPVKRINPVISLTPKTQTININDGRDSAEYTIVAKPNSKSSETINVASVAVVKNVGFENPLLVGDNLIMMPTAEAANAVLANKEGALSAELDVKLVNARDGALLKVKPALKISKKALTYKLSPNKLTFTNLVEDQSAWVEILPSAVNGVLPKALEIKPVGTKPEGITVTWEGQNNDPMWLYVNATMNAKVGSYKYDIMGDGVKLQTLTVTINKAAATITAKQVKALNLMNRFDPIVYNVTLKNTTQGIEEFKIVDGGDSDKFAIVGFETKYDKKNVPYYEVYVIPTSNDVQFGSTYKVKLQATLDNIDNQTLTTGDISIKPVQTVKVTTPKVAPVLWQNKSSFSNKTTIDLAERIPAGVKVGTIEFKTEKNAAKPVNNPNDAYGCTFDPNTQSLYVWIKDASKVKVGKATLTFSVTYEGQGKNNKGQSVIYDFKVPVEIKK